MIRKTEAGMWWLGQLLVCPSSGDDCHSISSFVEVVQLFNVSKHETRNHNTPSDIFVLGEHALLLTSTVLPVVLERVD